MQRKTSNLSTRQRLGFAISRVSVASQELALLVKLIGSNMKQTTLEKLFIGLFLTLATSVLLVGLYFFVKAIVGFDN